MADKIPLILATTNQGKAREIKKLLSALPISIKTLNDLPKVPKIVESGKTFEDNARKKAEVIARRFKTITLADDSGLMVNALGGKPGVRSARFVRPPVTAERLSRKLLKVMAHAKSKATGAKFVCAVAIAVPGKRTRIVRGVCHGRIIGELRGRRGFGYDPVFRPCGYKRTFAEMSTREKNRISHRAKAFRKAAFILQHILTR